MHYQALNVPTLRACDIDIAHGDSGEGELTRVQENFTATHFKSKNFPTTDGQSERLVANLVKFENLSIANLNWTIMTNCCHLCCCL